MSIKLLHAVLSSLLKSATPNTQSGFAATARFEGAPNGFQLPRRAEAKPLSPLAKFGAMIERRFMVLQREGEPHNRVYYAQTFGMNPILYKVNLATVSIEDTGYVIRDPEEERWDRVLCGLRAVFPGSPLTDEAMGALQERYDMFELDRDTAGEAGAEGVVVEALEAFFGHRDPEEFADVIDGWDDQIHALEKDVRRLRRAGHTVETV